MGTRPSTDLTLNRYYYRRRNSYLLKGIWYGRFARTNVRKSDDTQEGETVRRGLQGVWRGMRAEKWKVVRSGA